jgi:hypothetical protein
MDITTKGLRVSRVSTCSPNVGSWSTLSGGSTATEIHLGHILQNFVNFTFLKMFNFTKRQYLLELV